MLDAIFTVESLTWALVALQIVDLLTTVYALTRYPQYASEANGILAPLMRAIGVLSAMLIVKAAYCGFILWLVFWSGAGMPRDVLVFLVLFYVAVAVWNLNGIRKAAGWDAEKRRRAGG